MPGKKVKSHQRPGWTRERLEAFNEEAGCLEYEVTLERLAGGSTVRQEAERLNLSPGGLLMYFWRDPDLKDAYQDALDVRAEAIHDTQYSSANKLIDKADTLTREEISATDRGLHHLENIKRSDGARHKRDKSAQLSLTPDNLKEFLASLEQAKQAKALEDKTIEAEYVDAGLQDVKSEPAEPTQ